MTLFRQRSLALILATAVGSLLTHSVYAEELSPIQKRLNEIVPGAPAATIQPSPIAGLYQVTLGTKVLYMSKDGQYLLNGSLIDLQTRENLTDAAGNQARKAALAKLDESTMLIYPAKGKTLRQVTVFTDVDCPYCRKLHQEIPALNQAGIDVRYLAYPRAGVGSEVFHKTVSVWCADDANKAMDQAMSGEAIPAKTCDHPVIKHLELGQVFEVTGTPNMIFDSGERIPGFAPASELIQILTPKK